MFDASHRASLERLVFFVNIWPLCGQDCTKMLLLIRHRRKRRNGSLKLKGSVLTLGSSSVQPLCLCGYFIVKVNHGGTKETAQFS